MKGKRNKEQNNKNIRIWIVAAAVTTTILFLSKIPFASAFAGKRIHIISSTLPFRRILKEGQRNRIPYPSAQRSLSIIMSNNSDNKEGSKSHKVAVHWFRNGLRLHDNAPLLDACQNSETLLPLYIIDPEAPFAQSPNRKAGTIRANFILESIRELNTKLQAISQDSGMNSRLVVLLGKPEIVLPAVMESIGATALYYEREPAEPIRNSDAKVLDGIDDTVDIVGYDTHTLHPMEHYLTKCKGQVAPSTYGAFTKIFHQLGSIPIEVETVTQVPPLPPLMAEMTVGKDDYDDDDNKYMECPSLERLGYDSNNLKTRFKSGIDFYGGEDAGVKLLNTMMTRKKWVCEFEKPKTKPNALKVDTTGLSACKFCFIRS